MTSTLQPALPTYHNFATLYFMRDILSKLPESPLLKREYATYTLTMLPRDTRMETCPDVLAL